MSIKKVRVRSMSDTHLFYFFIVEQMFFSAVKGAEIFYTSADLFRSGRIESF